MNKILVYATIDRIKERVNGQTVDRICNYIEANIDEFIECYEVEE